MERQLSMESTSMTLHEYEQEYKGRIKFDAWYQRPEVWSLEKKQKLIDSIIRQYDIGVIYLRKLDEDDYDYEVLDGQQRLRAINQFLDGEFQTDASLNREVGSITYDELVEDNEYYPNWVAFTLTVQRITSDSDRAVADFFLRLQEGMKLRTPEILNAIVGEMRDTVIELSEHQIFNKLGINNDRYRYRLLAAQAMKAEVDGDFENVSFPNMKRKSMKQLYEHHRKSVPAGAKSQVQRTFNTMDNILSDASFIQNQGDFLPIYSLVRHLKENYSIGGQEEKIEEFIRYFLKEVQSVDTSSTNVPQEKEPFHNYRVARRAGALSSKSFEDRYNIILGKCLEYIADIPQKDSERYFDHGQKLAIYSRDNGECQQCGEDVNFEEAEFHHKQRYEDGGNTVVSNGALVHVECHPRGK